jgi:hypothetical protein
MSIEGEKFLMRDLLPEYPHPIEEIEQERTDLIERARQELEIITPSLKELVSCIENEKPDLVLFLDKGARILAAPIRKYLSDRMGEQTPRIQRYNDDQLKTTFFRNEAIDRVVEEDFAPLAGKKVFYIDETFSNGRGAVALDKATSQEGVDMRYFALSQTKEPYDLLKEDIWEDGKFYGLNREEYKKDFERIINDPRITIYPNYFPVLFTKDAALLSVVDAKDDKTRSRYQLVSGEEADNLYNYESESGEILHSRHFDNPPDGMDWQEFDEKVREINIRTFRKLTHMIYDSLTKDLDSTSE